MNRLTWTLLALFLAILACSVVCVVFETPLAEESIDWLSFLAGAFLAAEGIYKFLKYRNAPSYVQLCRFLRIFIGANVFLVHLAEFMWGAHAPAAVSPLLGAIIDWVATVYAGFLMIEGIIRIFTGRGTACRAPAADQITRTIRVVIGSSVFTIHILQFMR